MVETERKYVQDLEVMQVRAHISVSLFFTDWSQKYATALSQSNTIDQDTIHLLFPGLNKLLNFQRKFLIRLESTAELPWKDQRWGLHFLENVSPIVPFSALNTCLMRRFHCLRNISCSMWNNRKTNSRFMSLTVLTTRMQQTS